MYVCSYTYVNMHIYRFTVTFLVLHTNAECICPAKQRQADGYDEDFEEEDEEEEDEEDEETRRAVGGVVAAAGVKGPGDGVADVGGTRAIRTDYPLLDFSVSVLHQRGRGFGSRC